MAASKGPAVTILGDNQSMNHMQPMGQQAWGASQGESSKRGQQAREKHQPRPRGICATCEDGSTSAAAMEDGPRGVRHFQASTQLHATTQYSPDRIPKHEPTPNRPKQQLESEQAPIAVQASKAIKHHRCQVPSRLQQSTCLHQHEQLRAVDQDLAQESKWA